MASQRVGVLRELWAIILKSRDNQFVQLAVVGAAGSVVYKGQQLLRMLWTRVLNNFRCQVRLQNREREIYDAVIAFIARQKMVQSTVLLAEKKRVKLSWMERVKMWSTGEDPKPELDLKPDNTSVLYTFMYNGKRVALYRKKGATITTGYNRQPLDQEDLTLTTWGRDHSVLQKLMQQAIDEEFEQSKTDDLIIWVRTADNWLGNWEKAVTKKRRDLSTVVLDKQLKDEIVADAKKFIEEPEYYTELGIPYRRGYLLYGPPGNGKTSFCQALAGQLGLDICMLNLSDTTLDDNALAGSLRDAPQKAIILIEDIDAAFVGRGEVAADSKSGGGRGGRSGGISFSGLLNAIDGAASQEGRILIMTTNHKERLDPALIRPGRADFHREIGNATREQAITMFKRFYAELPPSAGAEEAASLFGSRFPDSGDISMAMLQGFLQAYRGEDGMSLALAGIARLGRGDPIEQLAVIGKEDLPVNEYLRRVGLDHYASGFEFHGHFLTSMLIAASVDLKVVERWFPDLKANEEESRRMKLVLSGSETITKQMRLVDADSARDLFLLHAQQLRRSTRVLSLQIHEASSPEPQANMSVSAGLVRTRSAEAQAAEAEANAEDRALAARLVSTLVDEKTHRGKCSVWQLERFLSLHSHPKIDCDLEVMLQGAAAALVAPEQEVLQQYSPMTVYDWLVRFGNLLGGRQEIAAAADALEENGWRTVIELLAAKPDVEKLKSAGVEEAQAEVIASVVKWDAERPDLMRGLSLPDRRRVLRELLLAFPSESDETIRTLAAALCTHSGRGNVSLHQITAFVSRYNDVADGRDEGVKKNDEQEQASLDSEWKGGGATAALLDVQNELLGASRPEKPAPEPQPEPEPTYVGKWLADVGLTELCDMFEEQGLADESDLDRPLFNPGELGRLTKTVGQQRRLMKALKALHGKQDLHVNASP
eukprot:COSAG02_NODE_4591_length_5182_cov_5.857761_3_plen_939_part_00